VPTKKHRLENLNGQSVTGMAVKGNNDQLGPTVTTSQPAKEVIDIEDVEFRSESDVRVTGMVNIPLKHALALNSKSNGRHGSTQARTLSSGHEVIGVSVDADTLAQAIRGPKRRAATH
jgi:hypothetical protein